MAKINTGITRNARKQPEITTGISGNAPKMAVFTTGYSSDTGVINKTGIEVPDIQNKNNILAA